MVHYVTILGQLRGLNEVLQGITYIPRAKRKYQNLVKRNNDEQCIFFIRQQLNGVKITKPIVIHYDFYCQDKRHDRMNIASATDKSFQDALQKCDIIKNDGWDDVINCTFSFYIDRDNPRTEVTITELEDYQKEF